MDLYVRSLILLHGVVDNFTFNLYHGIQPGSRVHPAAYPMGTGGYLPAVKVAGAWNWPLALNYSRSQSWWSYISTPPYVLMVWDLWI
jgi:hypothetical protein